MSTRLDALTERLDAPLLITNLTNIFYLTGFDTSNAALHVEPQGGATLYTDFRYAESARAVAGVDVEITKRALLATSGSGSRGECSSRATCCPTQSGSGSRPARRSSADARDRRCAAGRKGGGGGRQAPARRKGRRPRSRGADRRDVDRTEREELAWRLRELLHAHGADELSFDSIVASGPNGALPHAHPTERIVEKGTLVTVDWGARVDGYCSDCTRTFSTGRLPDRLREAYDVCLEAQKHACANIKAGMTGVEADALARDPITAAGFGANFGHGLGHGVGLRCTRRRASQPSPRTRSSGPRGDDRARDLSRRPRRRADRGLAIVRQTVSSCSPRSQRSSPKSAEVDRA